MIIIPIFVKNYNHLMIKWILWHSCHLHVDRWVCFNLVQWATLRSSQMAIYLYLSIHRNRPNATSQLCFNIMYACFVQITHDYSAVMCKYKYWLHRTSNLMYKHLDPIRIRLGPDVRVTALRAVIRVSKWTRASHVSSSSVCCSRRSV
jgi:hypothetical protein